MHRKLILLRFLALLPLMFLLLAPAPAEMAGPQRGLGLAPERHGGVIPATAQYTITDLQGPGRQAINSLGEAAGGPSLSLPEPAYGLPAGLNDLGRCLISAREINDAGQIIGIGTHNVEGRGFLQTPMRPWALRIPAPPCLDCAF